MAAPSTAPPTLIKTTHTTVGGGPLSAQCPACSLHELVPIHLTQDSQGRWTQLPAKSPASAAKLTIDACPVCFGVWFDQDEIDTLGDVDIDPVFLKTLVGRSANRMCPRGHGFMNEHVIPELLRTPIDRCPVCRGLWLDGDERKALARSSTREGQEDRKVALAKRGLIWAAQILTALPVEVENPARGTPWVVYTISTLLVGCYVASVLGVVYARELALIPGAFVRHPGELYKLFTHMFFHADWFHLLGNLYFFYTFGDNVEHIYGRRRFVALFLLAGILGGLAQVLLTRATAMPVIGASGAIAGVMGAYLWIYPRARLLQVIPVLYIQLKIPVWAYLCFWLGCQVAMGFFSHTTGMAWFSHIAGFCVGMAMTPWVLRRRRDEVAKSVRFRSAQAIFGDRLRKSAPPPSTPATSAGARVPGVAPQAPSPAPHAPPEAVAPPRVVTDPGGQRFRRPGRPGGGPPIT